VVLPEAQVLRKFSQQKWPCHLTNFGRFIISEHPLKSIICCIAWIVYMGVNKTELYSL
jgi:hypothetical protein